MENKIGDVITLPDGRKAEVVEYHKSGCFGCILDTKARLCANSACLPEERTDHKNIIYKEVKD